MFLGSYFLNTVITESFSGQRGLIICYDLELLIDKNTVSNSEVQDGTKMSGINLELHDEPEISAISSTIIDLDMNADEDSDNDPPR